MRSALPVLCLLVAGCSPPAPPAQAPNPAPVPVSPSVAIADGLVRGAYTDEDETVLAFKGIPYAAPPVGDLRWRPPAPPASWQGELDATAMSPACPQPPQEEGSFYEFDTGPEDEDCLYLNVWTGAKDSGEKRPVMVWIHGGGFVAGTAATSVYDGEQLARDGIVLVSINYRLGLMGFFAHPALTAESAQGASGNQGLHDQIAALGWVRDNIATFGGDPGNVTIFGESAGAISVCYLTATPLAQGLFQKAIAQSGGCFAPHKTLDDANGVMPEAPGELAGGGHEIGVGIAAALGVEGTGAEALQALRARDAKEMILALAEAGVSAPWRSIFVDGHMFADQMRALFDSRQANQVDAIVGATADEGTTLFMEAPETDYEAWAAEVVGAFGEPHGTRLVAAYEDIAKTSTKAARQQMLGDQLFNWEMRTWARLAEAAGTRAWLYQFSHAPSVEDYGRSLGAFHAAEIAYAFGNGGAFFGDGAEWDESDDEVTRIVNGYWVNFAKSGDPNGEGLPTWPAYRAAEDLTLEITAAPSVVPGLRKERLDAYDALFGG